MPKQASLLALLLGWGRASALDLVCKPVWCHAVSLSGGSETNCSSSKGMRKVHVNLVGKQTTVNILRVWLASKAIIQGKQPPAAVCATFFAFFQVLYKWEGVGEVKSGV